MDSFLHFIPVQQRSVIIECLDGEEREFFLNKMIELQETIQAMPVTYQQDGMGDNAIAHLHYFSGGQNWYITEKDMEGDGTIQAFGMVDLGFGSEMGYISIAGLVQINIIELDLHWQKKTLAEISASERR